METIRLIIGITIVSILLSFLVSAIVSAVSEHKGKLTNHSFKGKLKKFFLDSLLLFFLITILMIVFELMYFANILLFSPNLQEPPKYFGLALSLYGICIGLLSIAWAQAMSMQSLNDSKKLHEKIEKLITKMEK